jgi:hypothetical protein
LILLWSLPVSKSALLFEGKTMKLLQPTTDHAGHKLRANWRYVPADKTRVELTMKRWLAQQNKSLEQRKNG